MHKDFYASGFIYHPPTQQILLQQKPDKSFVTMFGGINIPGEAPETTFQRIIHSILKIKLNINLIHEVYSYFHKDMHKTHCVLYAEIEEINKFSNNPLLTWYTFKQVVKLQIVEQVKHDITVGQRVIDAKKRKDQGLKTLE